MKGEINMTTEQILIKALLSIEPCNILCKHGYRENGYPDCDIDWCDNHEDFELDIDKVKKEYDIVE